MPEKSEPIYAAFAANVKSLDSLRRGDGIKYCPGAVKVEKQLVLSPADFEKLAEDISPDYPFIKDNQALMSADPGGWFHCVLVTAQTKLEGLLVANGRRELYLGYTKDYRKLELPSDLPVQHISLEEPKVYQEKAAFFRKAINAEALMDTASSRLDNFCIEKVVVLSDEAFQAFKDGGLLEAQIYLFDNYDRMYFDPIEHCWHCLLVKGETGKDGILVEAEGYSYARYAAFAPDCDKLRLKDVPVHYEPSAASPENSRQFDFQFFTIQNSSKGYCSKMRATYEITTVYEMNGPDFTRFTKSPSLKTAFVSNDEYRKDIGMGPVDYIKCALLVCTTDNRGLLISTGWPGDVITSPIVNYRNFDLPDVPHQPLSIAAIQQHKTGPHKKKGREPIR